MINCEMTFDENIHPCKGCEDYVRGGCKSNGGCGAQAKLKDLIMEVFNMRPSTANKCIAILDDIKAIIERETNDEAWNRRAIGTCKDCKYSYMGNYFRGYACSYNDDGTSPNTVKEDHFCGYWKPKFKEGV